jgi:hypothetical protein
MGRPSGLALRRNTDGDPLRGELFSWRVHDVCREAWVKFKPE